MGSMIKRIDGLNGSVHFRLPISDSGIPSFPVPNLQSGMTLIEVIVVVAIIGIISAVAVSGLGSSSPGQASANGAAQMIASDIRYAQEFAMANRISKSVIFTAGSSVYAFSPAGGLDGTGRLPEGITVTSSFTITFNSLGEPTAGGGGSVTISSGGQTKTISVTNYTGKVNIS